MPTRLFSPDIEEIEQDVIVLDTFFIRNVPDADRYKWVKDQLKVITKHIKTAKRLPEKFYRKRRHTTTDGALMRTGLMHLHLEDGSPELLYLYQYPKFVVFVGVDTHAPFDDDPPLSTIHENVEIKLKEAVDRQMKALEEARQQKKSNIKNGILPRNLAGSFDRPRPPLK